MEKVGIKAFVERYENCATEKTKKDCLKDYLEVKKYIPFNLKVALAERLVSVTCFETIEKKDFDGKSIREKTGRIKNDSVGRTLLFYRIVVEQYTNLTVETAGFYEEYDMLRSSGILEYILASIPEDERAEFSRIVDMKVSDTLSYYDSPQKFVSDQVERFGTLIGVTLNPFLEKLADQLGELDEEHIDKLAKIVATGAKLKILK